MADKLTLDHLPLAALMRYMEQHFTPDGDTFLLPHSVGADSLDPSVLQAPANAVRVYNSTAVSAAGGGANTILPFDSERFDTDNFHDPADNTKLTCRIAGTYVVGGCIEWPANVTSFRSLRLQLNGGAYVAMDTRLAVDGGAATRQVVETVLQLAVGDYVQFVASQNSGGALNVNATPNYSPEAWMVRVPGNNAGIAGPATPQLVSALPSSPVDGQEIYYLADATNGVVWHLRYRAASASIYKWEYVGGPDLTANVAPSTATTLNSVTHTAFPGMPTITLPLSGDYNVTHGAGTIGNNGTWTGAYDSFTVVDIGGTEGTLAWVTSTGSFGGGAVSVTQRRNGITAGQVATWKMFLNNAPQTSRCWDPFMAIRPIRVGP